MSADEEVVIDMISLRLRPRLGPRPDYTGALYKRAVAIRGPTSVCRFQRFLL